MTYKNGASQCLQTIPTMYGSSIKSEDFTSVFTGFGIVPLYNLSHDAFIFCCSCDILFISKTVGTSTRMNIDTKALAKGFLSKNKIVISDTVNPDDIVEALSRHIDALIYNMVSLVALVAMIQDDKKIYPRHLVSAQAYIAHKCIGDTARRMITGGVGKGITKEQMDTIDLPVIEGFELDEAAMGCLNIDLRSYIHNVLSFHDVSISKGAMKSMIGIIHAHLGCLLKDIRANEPITMTRLATIMGMRKHAIFK